MFSYLIIKREKKKKENNKPMKKITTLAAHNTIPSKNYKPSTQNHKGERIKLHKIIT